jgi:regulator of protease activity HflC (stomatin/prohibitin superfamily)
MNLLPVLAPLLVAAALVTFYITRKLRRRIVVPEGYAALLYHRGKFAGVLLPGIHIRWGMDYTTTAHDMRKAQMCVTNQEVLTADRIAIKTGAILVYQVTDPIKASHYTQHWQGDLHTAAQLALRAVVAETEAEVLLGRPAEIDDRLIALVRPAVADIGVTIHSARIRDVTPPNDLKRAYAEVLKVKQEGQVALERARAESAALRNLANAARLLEDNPALMNLRLMQTLGTAQAAGSTLVLGMPGGFLPLKRGAQTVPTKPD